MKHFYLKLSGILICIIGILSIIMFIPDICNWYTDNIYIYIAKYLGMVSAVIQFPLGEILMYCGALLVVLSIILIPFFNHVKKYYKIFSTIVLLFILIYYFNWLIPFHSEGVSIKTEQDKTYTIEELQKLRDYLVVNLNTCAKMVPRQEDGSIAACDNMDEMICNSIQNMSTLFPRLGGYVPPVKKAFCSPFLEWMNIGGYTYPYTMEITGNKYNDRMYYPSFYAHEASHHFGYYKENDAEFISDIVCMNSEDWRIKYSGFYFAYCYVDNDYWNSLVSIYEGDKNKAREYYHNSLQPIKQVEIDRKACKEEMERLYRKNVSQKFEDTFQSAAESVADVGWETQANILKDAIYSGVVKLLLQYYDGKL